MKKLLLLPAVSIAIWFVAWALHVDRVHAQAGQNNGQYLYISTATTTLVRGAVYFNSVSISGGAGTITFYDIVASGCTGTPASGKFAVITQPASAAPVTLFYEINVKNGLCVVTSATNDVTVSYN